MASVKHNTETIVNFDPQSNCQTDVSAVLTALVVLQICL